MFGFVKLIIFELFWNDDECFLYNDVIDGLLVGFEVLGCVRFVDWLCRGLVKEWWFVFVVVEVGELVVVGFLNCCWIFVLVVGLFEGIFCLIKVG